MSTAFHPQTDGQTERTNRTLEDMLRAYVSHRQDDWDRFLTAAEFSYNSHKNASTELSPFEFNYGQQPHVPSALFKPTSTHVQTTTEFLTSMENLAKMATDSLVKAKGRQEEYANRSRRPLVFRVGDLVLLSSAHITLASQSTRPSKKLQHRYIGPYHIAQVISPVAYKLNLPANMRVHPVFHVSLLKPYTSPNVIDNRPPAPEPPPAITVDDHVEYEVEKILDKRKYRGHTQYLVKWAGYPDYDATWEPLRNLKNVQDLIKEFESGGPTDLN